TPRSPPRVSEISRSPWATTPTPARPAVYSTWPSQTAAPALLPPRLAISRGHSPAPAAPPPPPPAPFSTRLPVRQTVLPRRPPVTSTPLLPRSPAVRPRPASATG